MAVARRAEERVGELEREHRRLVDDHEVEVVGERGALVALEAALPRRVAERAVDRHRLVPGEVAHAPRGLAGRRAEQHALARAARGLDEHALRVRLARARKAGEQDEGTRAHELDDGPLLVGHLLVGAVRRGEELDRPRARAARASARPRRHSIS